MTTMKLAAKLPRPDEETAAAAWKDLGGMRLAIVELYISERVEPAAEVDTEPSVKFEVASIEFASDDQDEALLRRALRARYEKRTSSGTLTEDLPTEDPLPAATAQQ